MNNNNDDDDPSLISLSDSFEDDSLLLDTDNPIFARPPPVNPSARNPFAKPVVKTAQAYLDLKNSDIYDVDDDDEEEKEEKRVEVVQKSKDIKNMKNNTKPKNSRDPTIELIEIDDDDDDDDFLNHTGLSQSLMNLRTRTPIKNASTPRRTSPRKASTFNRDLVDPIDLDPTDHMIHDTSPIRSRASSIVSSPKKKPRTTPPDEMIVVDLTMEEDDEELKKKGQRSRSRSRSAAIRKAFHFDDSLDFLTATNSATNRIDLNDGDDGDKSIRPTVPITRNIRRKESSIRRKAQTSTNEIHIDLTLDSPMVDNDEDVIEIIDDEKVSTIRVATTSTVTTSETISRNDSSNLIEESTISTTTTSINTSSTRFSDIKARFDALVKRSSGASSTSTSTTIPAPKEDEPDDLRPPSQSTQERELIHELEDMSSFSTSDFTILKERRSEDQPGPSRDDWFELDDDDDLGPPVGMGIVPSQRLPKSHSTPFPPITSTTVPAPKATKPRAKKANRQLLSGKKVTKLKGTTSKTTTKTTSKNQRRVNQNLFTEDLDEDLGDDDEQGQQESTGPKQPVMKQSDAIRHITVHVPAAVLELAPTELARLKIEKELDYAVVEDGSVEDDGDEMDLCVRWKARPILEQMLKEVDGSVKVQRSSGFLDHLLVVVQAGLLHDCVGRFVESLKDKDSINSNDIPEDECDLYGIVHKCCTKYGIHNVTVVLHGVESYLKSQRSQANILFRRKLKNLMAEQNGVDAAQVDGNNKKNRTRKKKDQPEKESRIELTLDNIEMCLIDARMRFYYAHDEAHAHFGTVHVDSEEDLAKVIYQYTRSLSEQIFRLTKTRSSCIDFYAVHDKMVSIDPNTAQNRKDLWLRQLQQFPSISAMSAELIAHCFTSPKVMFDALRQSEDPVKMLAETGIGRKKIGLELACKIVQFMTTVEPDLVLKSLTGCTT